MGISVLALRSAGRSAKASERQARAAEAQAEAIPAQLAAAKSAADAAHKQAELAIVTANEAKRIAQLSEAHMQASLQPILVLERREDRLRSLLDFLVNSGDGPAINVTAQYGGAVLPGSEVSVPNMLSSKGESSIRDDGGRAQKENLILRYESQDGRKFQTQIGVDSNWKPTHRHKALDARDQLQ